MIWRDRTNRLDLSGTGMPCGHPLYAGRRAVAALNDREAAGK